jgi:hypothetical protein
LRIKDPWILPYGYYAAGKFSVLFDRRYQPIVMLHGRWPDCDLSRAVRCDPDWWIEHESETRFYNDRTTPTYNLKTRAELKKLVLSIPGLAKEIERRNAKAVAA